MAEILSPFVYWGQNNEKIFLKVDLKDVSGDNAQVDISEEELRFKAYGTGLRGLNNYEFNLEFYLPVDSEKSRYRVGGRFIEFQIQKIGVGEIWPRLIVEQKKPPWLKIDFDHFAFNDSDEDSDDIDKQLEAEQSLLSKLEKEINQVQASAFADMKSLYLFIYNMFMWVGFSYVFIALSYRYWRDGEESKSTAYDGVGAQLMVCQLAATLEIIHPILGLVKTDIYMPLVQVLGRDLVLFVLIGQEPLLQSRHVVWWLFLTWSAVELVRYPYYMLNIVKLEWSVVTWLRYTVWIPLYPLGFMFEGFTMLLALPYFERSGKFTIELPNFYNFAFPFPTILRVYMLCYLPGMYILMRRMYDQRKKKIPPGALRRRKPASKNKQKTS